MPTYTQVTDFSAKDGLAPGNPLKVIKGADIDLDLAAIATAIALAYDSGEISSAAEAAAMTSNAKIITPLRLKSALEDATNPLTACMVNGVDLETSIATNTTNIATNVTDIATNTTDIATNTTDIATNTTDIATNVSAIAANFDEDTGRSSDAQALAMTNNATYITPDKLKHGMEGPSNTITKINVGSSPVQYGALKLKTADETISSDASLTADGTMGITGLDNTAFYAVDIVLNYSQVNGASNGLKVSVSPTMSGNKMHIVAVWEDGSTISREYMQNNSQLNASDSTAGSERSITMRGYISEAATFDVNWAQHTSNASDTTVRKGSYVMLTKLSP